MRRAFRENFLVSKMRIAKLADGDYRFYLGLYSNEALKILNDVFEEYSSLFYKDCIGDLGFYALRSEDGEIYLLVPKTDFDSADAQEKDFWCDDSAKRYIKAFNENRISEDVLFKGYFVSHLVDALGRYDEDHVIKKPKVLLKALTSKNVKSDKELDELVGEKIHDTFKLMKLSVLKDKIEKTSKILEDLEIEYIKEIGLRE